MRALAGFSFIFGVLAIGVVGTASAAPKKAKPAPEAPLPAATRGPTNTADLVGRYAVLRGDRDTGCMLTLSAGNANLAPACRDNGIVIFDPKGWSLTQRRLALRARKGHTALFEMDEKGAWEREGKHPGPQLGFRKM